MANTLNSLLAIPTGVEKAAGEYTRDEFIPLMQEFYRKHFAQGCRHTVSNIAMHSLLHLAVQALFPEEARVGFKFSKVLFLYMEDYLLKHPDSDEHSVLAPGLKGLRDHRTQYWKKFLEKEVSDARFEHNGCQKGSA